MALFYILQRGISIKLNSIQMLKQFSLQVVEADAAV